MALRCNFRLSVYVKQSEETIKKTTVMKKQFVMMMAAAMLCCASCVKMGIKKLVPSDNVVKNEYPMTAFNKVDIDMVARVSFVQSPDGDYRVLLRCPDNYVDLFKFSVDDGELNLRFAQNLHSSIEAKDVDVVVCSPTLLKLESEGVGTVSIDSLKTPSLDIESEGVSSITIKGLDTQRLTVESSGVGSVRLEGRTTTALFECSGVGDIDAKELNAADVKAEISGVGSITCFASKSITGGITGVGSLKYAGHPQQKHLSRNGIGKITEL